MFEGSQQLAQLYTAHVEAERVGLKGGGLATANGLQQAAARGLNQRLQGV